MDLAIRGSIPLITRGTCRDGDNLQEMEYDSEGSERELWRDWPANENCQVQIIVFQFSHIRDSSQEASLFEVDKIRPCCDT